MTKKILIVEDEKSLAEALYEKFTKEKFNVVIAKHGEEGLKKAKKEKPDLILLDIIMPVMDGLTMLKKMRSEDWGKDIPVIMLTNLNDSDKIDESLKEGAYDYLVKTSWKLEDIMKKVNKKIGKK